MKPGAARRKVSPMTSKEFQFMDLLQM